MRCALTLVFLVALLPWGAGRAAQQSGSWLLENQEADGRWDADGFMGPDPVGERSGGAGLADWDVGATALATFSLAFEQSGSADILRATGWLLAQQDSATGLIGDSGGSAFRLQHALATLALCEVLYFELQGEPGVDLQRTRAGARSAAQAIVRAQAADGGWSANGELPADAFHTGWMLHALVAARDAGIAVDEAVLAQGLAWFARRTDPATGRVTFGAQGTPDPFGVATTEISTAHALLLRILIDRPREGDALVAVQAQRLRQALPASDGAGFRADPTYWLLGGAAMFQMGGRSWMSWNRAQKKALLRWSRSRSEVGSRSQPHGVLGPAAGRVGEFALTALVLDMYARVAAFAGAR